MYVYFKSKFDHNLRPTPLAFKAAWYFSPSQVCKLRLTANDLKLNAWHFFPKTWGNQSLKSELPLYFIAAEDASDQVDAVEWWKAHESDLPLWSNAFKLIILMQPSFAAEERVFLLLASSFAQQQELSLEDYIQFSVMLQYNYCVYVDGVHLFCTLTNCTLLPSLLVSS